MEQSKFNLEASYWFRDTTKAIPTYSHYVTCIEQ